MRLDRDRPEILTTPEHPQQCCTQQTITAPPQVSEKTRQKHDYPPAAWRRSYARRTGAERGFATAKDPAQPGACLRKPGAAAARPSRHPLQARPDPRNSTRHQHRRQRDTDGGSTPGNHPARTESHRADTNHTRQVPSNDTRPNVRTQT